MMIGITTWNVRLNRAREHSRQRDGIGQVFVLATFMVDRVFAVQTGSSLKRGELIDQARIVDEINTTR